MEYLLKPNIHLDEEAQRLSSDLAAEFSLEPTVADIMVARGIRSPEEARQFLAPQPQHLHDPFLFRDMKKAVSLIGNTVAAGGKIWIHGDYDADGTSAAALLQQALKRMGADVECHIPDRQGRGYGLAMKTVEEMAGAALLITVDCGITSADEIRRAHELGLRTIVTDHHTPPVFLPEPDALLNPKVEGETYPFAGLCGAGVAFKLAQALIGEQALGLIDLAAFGTVADVVPLTGENRTIVSLGLAKFNRDPNLGLAALYAPHKARRGPLTAEGIGFLLGPCVNAAGRMSSARLALDLMNANSPVQAEIVAKTLIRLNADRQERQKQIIEQVEERLAAMDQLPDFIVLADRAWETGLVGIAASAVSERHRRPVALLGSQGGQLFTGSARGTDDISVYDALKTVEALLVKFGGHAGAAGLTVEEENIASLQKALNGYAAGRVRPDARLAAGYDFEAALPLDTDVVRALEVLEPCGLGNPRPRVLIRQADIGDVRGLSRGAHAAFSLHTGTGSVDAVRFRTSPDALPRCADVVGTLSVIASGSGERVQIVAEVLSVDEGDDAIFAELAREVCRADLPEEPWRFRCSKKRLGLIYSAFRHVSGRGGPLSWRRLYQGSRRLVPGLRREEFVFAVCVFTQLKLLGGTKDAKIHVIPSPPKRSLDESDIYRRFEGVQAWI